MIAAVYAAVALGCGARSDLLEEPDRSAEPRVEDCERLTPEATPLAVLAPSDSVDGTGVDPFHLADDDTYLYFISEGRVFRIAKAAGAAEPLTPPGSAGGRIHVTADALVWSKGGDIQRAPLDGGDPTLVVELEAPLSWDVVAGFIISSGPYPEPSPVLRTPLAGGPSEELMAAPDPDNFVQKIGADGDAALVERASDLLAVPVNGGPVVVLAEGTSRGAAPPVADGEAVYFGASSGPVLTDMALFRQPKASGSPTALVLGFPVWVALDEDDVYANVALPQPDGAHAGAIVRVPKAGGVPVKVADTDAKSLSGSGSGFQYSTAGHVVDDENVYFIELCVSQPGDATYAYRLVSLPKDFTAAP